MKKSSNACYLTTEDRVRLERIAPLFEFDFIALEGDIFSLSIFEDGGRREFLLPAGSAHQRLLLEICGKTAPWVYFHFGKSCRASLLEMSDARIERLAVLVSREAKFTGIKRS